MAQAAQKGEDCFRLIYRSHSKIKGCEENREQELANILKVARRNNPAVGITGALVLYDDWFAQVLEGNKQTVVDLLSKIDADPRHSGVKVFEEEPNAKRVFGKWAMALVAEHGHADVPLVARKDRLDKGADWDTSEEQEDLVDKLRNLTRGYGIGS